MPLAEGIVEIKTGTSQHKKIIEAFRSRLRRSADAQKKRTKQWQEAEDSYLSYIPAQEADELRKANRKSGMPQYTTVAVPYNYATLLSAHTYYTSVFLARSPIIQVSGRHGESQNAEMAIESLCDYQIQSGGGLVPLFAWLLDPGKYGIGWLGHHWDEEITTVVTYQDVPETKLGFKTGRMIRQPVESEVVGYQGNRFFNLRPQDAFPDPGVTAKEFQKGEFFIRFTQLGYHEIKRRASQGRYYNVEQIAASKEQADSIRDTGSPRVELPNENLLDQDYYRNDSTQPTFTNIHEFHWDCIPRELGIGSSSKMQKYVFTIANQTTIISCQPLGLASNKYPFDVLEHEIDAYPIFNRGLLEIMDPLNKTMEWLFNSHFYNVRAALNNQFIVDPSRVVMKDLENPEPGKLIRLKPMAYGNDVRTLISQLPVADITRSHIPDTQMVAEILQRISGVNDTVMGMQGGGRKTATEIRSSTTFGINRMKTNCEYFSAMGFAPLTQKLIQSTQQLYSVERKFRIVGNAGQFGEKYLNVKPSDIAGFYDFVPVDGTLPVDRFAQANLWKEIMGQLAADPQIRSTYDFAKIFGYVAHLAGIKNIDQFRVSVQDPAALTQQAQMGNMVPVSEVANLNEPGQIPNVGPTA